jgi:hypothetical protein
MFAVLLTATLGGIYPDDLFTSGRSVQLNSDTFDDHVKSEVAAGRTLFVRFIASEGLG